MKNILILNGAGKKNGKTAAMVKAFSGAAEVNGNIIKEFYLQNMNIHGCLDCGGCRRMEKDVEIPCVQKDDMTEIYIAFKNADVVVFACPVYWWDITGTLKTAIDRLYGFVGKFDAMSNKETVLLMTSGGSTIDHMMDWYKGFEHWMGWKSLGEVMNDMDKAKEIGESIA